MRINFDEEKLPEKEAEKGKFIYKQCLFVELMKCAQKIPCLKRKMFESVKNYVSFCISREIRWKRCDEEGREYTRMIYYKCAIKAGMY